MPSRRASAAVGAASLKSPRAVDHSDGADRHLSAVEDRLPARQATLLEFVEDLRTRVNGAGRPYQEGTISRYADAAVALDGWLTAQGLEGDFTVCDAAVLNRFFADYYARCVREERNAQGGTNTLQRNLRHLFTWLEDEYEHPHPWASKDLQRYAAPKPGSPNTLASEFVEALLTVTGGGRSTGFEDARDHALIRLLLEGLRRTELMRLRTGDVPPDVVRSRVIGNVTPLKGARARQQGRQVALQPAAVGSSASGCIVATRGGTVIEAAATCATARLWPSTCASVVYCLLCAGLPPKALHQVMVTAGRIDGTASEEAAQLPAVQQARLWLP